MNFRLVILALIFLVFLAYFSQRSTTVENLTPYSWRRYYPWGGYRTFWDEYHRNNYPYEQIPYWKRLLY